ARRTQPRRWPEPAMQAGSMPASRRASPRARASPRPISSSSQSMTITVGTVHSPPTMQSRLRELDDRQPANDEAVDGEWRERAGLEVAAEEADRQVGRDRRREHADDDLPVDVVARAAKDVGGLEHPRGEDRRGGEEEREVRRILVIETACETANERDAGARDA